MLDGHEPDDAASRAPCRQRSPCRSQNDLPGPGTYEEHEAKVVDSRVYSKKGLGVGFVSKTKRDSAFKAASAAPGPGSYNRGGSFADRVAETNRANRSGTTSTFKPPSTKSVIVASDPTPGPGNYSVVRQFDPAQLNSGAQMTGPGYAASLQTQHSSSVFRSATQRGSALLSGGRGMPAPGQYDVPVPGTLDTSLPSAAFRSNVPIVGQGHGPRMTREQQLGARPIASASTTRPPSSLPSPRPALEHDARHPLTA